MGPFATAAMVLEAIFWIALLSVAGIFLAELIKGTIEDISDHRRILAARTRHDSSAAASEATDTRPLALAPVTDPANLARWCSLRNQPPGSPVGEPASR
jgi:hypothetical protein